MNYIRLGQLVFKK